jgi:hypothetical protein
MSNRFSQDTEVRVRKRDGSLEPLSYAKLLNCLRRGLEAGGEAVGTEASIAAGLAEAVHDHLRKAFREEPVDSKHLSELVEVVLAQTGHTAACWAAQQHRAMREQQRRRVMVANPRPSDGRYIRRRWDKSHIVQHLRRQHGLDAPVARMLAGRVEQLVFNCGLKVVTVGLVYEMIKSELLAWGLLPGALVVKKTRDPQRDSRSREV